MALTIYRLVLHPSEIDVALHSWRPVVEKLHEAGFLGGPYIGGSNGDSSEERYFAGDNFLQYITFMGCSPSIELTPVHAGSLNFCHIQCRDISTTVQFRCASQNVFARCPHCRKRITNWEQAVANWRAAASSVTFACDKCLHEVSLYELGWRHTAGFARMFMDVYSIYPLEGVPTEQLMQLLAQTTGTPWCYFYTDR